LGPPLGAAAGRHSALLPALEAGLQGAVAVDRRSDLASVLQ
jgi:hypothetical protein